MESLGILRSPAERSGMADVLKELVPESLGRRSFGIRRAYDRDIHFAARVTAANMPRHSARQLHREYPAGFLESFDDCENFILMFNGERAGVLRLECGVDGVWIRGLEVDEKYWNRGLGTEAVKYAQEFAQRQGLSALKVAAFTNSAAVRFYIRLGFEQVGGEGGVIRFVRSTHAF